MGKYEPDEIDPLGILSESERAYLRRLQESERTKRRGGGDYPLRLSGDVETTPMQGIHDNLEIGIDRAVAGGDISVETIVYECAVCHDKRFLRRDVDHTHPDFGRAIPCPNCTRLRQRDDAARARERLRDFYPLPDHARELALASFKTQHIDYSSLLSEYEKRRARGELRDAIQAARDLVDGLPDEFAILLLEDTYGTGKTRLAASVACRAWERGYSVAFMTSFDVVVWARQLKYSRDLPLAVWIEDMCLLDLLIIDEAEDAYALKDSDAAATFFRILNGRIENRRSMILNTNDASRLDPALASRLNLPQVKRHSMGGVDGRPYYGVGKEE